MYDENSECVLDYSRCTHQVGALSGVVCFHVDDMLGTSDELFESKLKELVKLVGYCLDEETKVRSLWKAVRETCQWRNYDFHEGIYSELEEG